MKESKTSKYNRVILKVSGEALAGENKFGLNEEVLSRVADRVKEVVRLGTEIAIVVGGGNFWRGRTGKNMDRATADYMGMLATTMNALALESAFKAKGMPARVMTAVGMSPIAEPYTIRKAVAYLERKIVVIFAAGTGSPFFSTDTAAALRAAETEADIILLAKNVDAVYSDDPSKVPNAVKYSSLTHREVLEKGLGVMDSAAASLCMDNNIPIRVFGLSEPDNILKAVCGEDIGTIVR
jgi:uridylate kinase